MEKANGEGIGSLKTFNIKTQAQQSSAEGKGISEATVGLKTQLVLTTRNAEGEQRYEEHDCVIVLRKRKYKITKMAPTTSAILPKKLENVTYL